MHMYLEGMTPFVHPIRQACTDHRSPSHILSGQNQCQIGHQPKERIVAFRLVDSVDVVGKPPEEQGEYHTAPQFGLMVDGDVVVKWWW